MITEMISQMVMVIASVADATEATKSMKMRHQEGTMQEAIWIPQILNYMPHLLEDRTGLGTNTLLKCWVSSVAKLLSSHSSLSLKELIH